MIVFIKHRLIIFTFILIIAAIFPTQILAQKKAQPVTIIVPANQVINHDYFAAGNNIIISGTVNGDTYIAGGNVDVNGNINGDLLVAGGQVNVRGTVAQNVRVVGGNIHITGKIGRNVSSAGGTVDVAPTAMISGSVVAAGGNFSLFGPVGKDLFIAGGNVELAGKVGGNADVRAGTLIVSNGANVAKDLIYTSPEKAQIASGAVIQGNTQYTPTPNQSQKQSDEAFWKTLLSIYIVIKLISFISGLIIGLLLIRFLPAYTSRTADYIRKDFWKSLGVGFLTLILAPFLIFLLLVSIIGIPIGLIIIASLLMVVYLAKIFAAVVIGRWIGQGLKKEYGMYTQFIIGAVLYFLLSLISPINFILLILVSFVGTGSVVLEEIQFYKTLHSKKLI